jgi:xylulokinase
MRLIGLDIGTTGCKTFIFDLEGNLLSSASREYTVDSPHPGWAEQDGEHIWLLAKESLREAIVSVNGENIAALGLSVQGEAVMPVDASGNALGQVILGMDTRTEGQNNWLREKFGAEYLFNLTGMPIHTINTLPKILWLKEHEPYLWSKARRFALYEDFLIHKMTGDWVISRCLASRTQMYDLRNDKWSSQILEAIGLESQRLSEVKPSGFAVGRMLPYLSKELGLKQVPLVATGGHDQACGALGVGLTRPGLAMVSTGTAEVVEVVMDSPILNRKLYEGNISCYAHVVPGMYLAMTLNHSGGLTLRWFKDELCQKEIEEAEVSGEDPYDLILCEASPEPSPILLLPHFSGSGTPLFDTASKGAILGLTFSTTKTHLVKAILEGLTFELRVNLDLLKDGEVNISELRAIGGGARSELWLQLKTDITGIPVIAPKVTDAACWGAALLAGTAAGYFPSLISASEETVKLEKSFKPDPGRMKRYGDRYRLFLKVYPAVKDINHCL